MEKRSGKGPGTALPFVLLCVASFFMYGVNNVMVSLAPIAVMDLGVSAAAAGFQGTFFIVTAIVLRTVLMPLTGRIGAKRLMIAGAVSFAVASALFPFCTTYGLFLAARVVQAVGLAVFWPLSVSAVVDVSDADNVGSRLGISRFATAASMAVGPYAAFALSDVAGVNWVYGALLLASGLAIVAIAACKLPEGPAQGKASAANAPAEGAGRETVHVKGAWFAGVLAVTVLGAATMGLVMHFSALVVGEIDDGLNAASYLSLFSIGGMVASLLVGRVLDRGKWHIALPACMAAMALGVMQLGTAYTGVLALTIGGMLAGFGNMGSTLCCMDIIARKAAPGGRDAAMGYRQSGVDIGVAVAATAFGVAFDVAPANQVVFLAWGAVMLGIAVVTCAVCLHSARRAS